MNGDIYRDALDVQDACNLRAIARLLVKAADRAADAGGTVASYRDPAVVLIVSKIESLVSSAERFTAAYDECERHCSRERARVADRVDGYDRDDVGESPDF